MLLDRFLSRKPVQRRIKAMVTGMATAILLSACMTSPAPQTQEVFVAEIDGEGTSATGAMTRQ